MIIYNLILAAVFSLCNSTYSDNCEELSKKLGTDFSAKWKDDKYGQSSMRKEYLKIFQPSFNKKDKLSLTGYSKSCIEQVFGPPERVLKKGTDEEVCIYFFFVNWLNDDKDYEGMTLEISFSNDNVSEYFIMMT